MTTHHFAHWRETPDSVWRWPDFTPAEIACRGSGSIKVDVAAMDALQNLRSHLDAPVIVTSGYRSAAHNTAVGGAERSRHLTGKAFDVSMNNQDPGSFERAARECGFSGFGFYPRSNFMHIDTGPERSWGQPFSIQASRFAADRPPARESLATSRTMAGGGAAGIGVIGSAGVEPLLDAIRDGQSALEDLIPYVGALRWGFLALTLLGISLTIYSRWDDWTRGRR